jgi:transcriptional regulator with XRE-family HTH domain
MLGIPAVPEYNEDLAHSIASIKSLRMKLGLSQKEFADKYGLKVGTIKHWERGDRQPNAAARAILDQIRREIGSINRPIDRVYDLLLEIFVVVRGEGWLQTRFPRFGAWSTETHGALMLAADERGKHHHPTESIKTEHISYCLAHA